MGDSNEPSAIIDVLPFILARNSDVAVAAAYAVHKLLLGTPATELAWLDWALRRLSPYAGDYFYEWHKISLAQLDLFEGFGEASVSLLAMASFHQNGYVREAAIKRLESITSGAELPFLLLRLNDWVSNVRDAAYQAIRFRLKSEQARSFIANLALVSRLKEAGRADQKGLLQAINKLLQSAECRPALLESRKRVDRFISRTGFRLVLNSTELNQPDVVRQALNDHDTMIRLWAAQRVSSAFVDTTLHHFLELMKHDRFMPVRREALRNRSQAKLAQVNRRTAFRPVGHTLVDAPRSSLSFAPARPIDVAAFYREHLLAGEGRTLYSAISGLGETGSAADDKLIFPFASHRARYEGQRLMR